MTSRLSRSSLIPIEQIIAAEGSLKRWSQAYLRYASRIGGDFALKLALHREKFGQETRVERGSEHYLHVWERQGYVVVLSKRGTDILIPEFVECLTNAWGAWRKYQKDLGLLS